MNETERLQEIINKRKEQNKLRQQRYRENIKKQVQDGVKTIEEVRDEKNKQMKKYRDNFKKRVEAVIVPQKEEPIKTIALQPIPKKKQEVIVKPYDSHSKIESSTLNDYISKIKIINRLILQSEISSEIESELTKLLTKKKFKKTVIKKALPYLKNINDTITKLRETYQKDTTFKSYINVLVVILRMLPVYTNQLNQVATLNVEILKKKEEENNENIVKKTQVQGYDQITIDENMKKLTKLQDKVIYIMIMFFLRRTQDIQTLIIRDNDDNTNNIVLLDAYKEPTQLIFNKYKTYKKFKKQTIDIPDNIKTILKEYMTSSEINIGDYLFSQENDKTKMISQANFSRKAKKILSEVYGREITINDIRTSYVTEKDIDRPSTGVLLKDANKLSHGLATHLNYRRYK